MHFLLIHSPLLRPSALQVDDEFLQTLDTMDDFYDPEQDLLGDDAIDDDSAASAHAFRTAPIFTGDAFALLGSSVLPQRALYGRIVAQKATGLPTRPATPKLYINTNAPFSAVVCGVQVRTTLLLCSVTAQRLTVGQTGIRQEPFDVGAPRKLFDGRRTAWHAA